MEYSRLSVLQQIAFVNIFGVPFPRLSCASPASDHDVDSIPAYRAQANTPEGETNLARPKACVLFTNINLQEVSLAAESCKQYDFIYKCVSCEVDLSRAAGGVGGIIAMSRALRHRALTRSDSGTVWLVDSPQGRLADRV